jgi:hypothetical protein
MIYLAWITDSMVYGLGDWCAKRKYIFLRHEIQTDCRAYAASYPVGTVGFLFVSGQGQGACLTCVYLFVRIN